MATSGNMTTTNTNIWYWIEAIQNSQDTANNTSNVTVRVWFQRTSGYTSYGSGTVYCKINGSVYSDGVTSSQKITSTPIKLFEHTLNIAHNSDGTKTLDMSAYISHSVVDSSYQSWSMNLTTIARASVPTMSDTTIDMGTAVTISTNRASNSFTHTISYSFGSSSGTIGTSNGVTTSVSWTPPTSLATQIPNATSGKGTITCKTYSGSTLIGTKTVDFTLYVPSTIVPSFTSVTHSEDSNTAVYGKGIGAYVQGLSKVSISINGASGASGSTIKSYSITFDGSSYSTATVTSGYVSGTGSLTITAKITDSRGRTATKTATATVLAYSTPKITAFSVERCNSDGTLNALGTYAKITRVGTVTNLNSKNYFSFNAYSKSRGTTTWTSKASGTSTAGTVSMSQTNIVSTYDITSSYDFKLDFSDMFNSVSSTAVLSTGGVTMSWGREGIGVGKIWEQGSLDVASSMYIDSTKIEAPSYVRISNQYGYVDIAPKNTSFAHFSTDRVSFHFDKPVRFDGALTVNSSLDVNGNVEANTLNLLGSNASIELYWSGGTPFIDFKNDTTSDYDMRIILTGDDELTITGGNYLKFTYGQSLEFPSNGYFYLKHSNTDYIRLRGGYFDMVMGSYIMEFSNQNISANGNIFVKSTNGYAVLQSSGTNDIYLQTGSEVRCVAQGTTATFKPILASAFTVNSVEESKEEIKTFEQSALDIVKNAKVYEYYLKSDKDIENSRRRKRKYGFVIGRETPKEVLDWKEEGVDLYAMNSMLWKAVQELTEQIDFLNNKIKRK